MLTDNEYEIRFSYILIPRFESFAGADGFHRALSVVHDSGYAGVELNMTSALLDRLTWLPSCLAEHDLCSPSFLTGEGYAEGLCLASPSRPVRERAIERLLLSVEAARTLGSTFVVGQMQGAARDEPDAVLARERIVEALRVVADAAEKSGVEFVIEPVNHLQTGFHNSVAEVLGLIADIGSPAVRPMVDTIHMNIEEKSMEDSIRSCGAALRHVHLCESNGGKFGSGHIDFHRVLGVLREIGYRQFCSVKVYRHLGLEEAARTSRAYFRHIAESGLAEERTVP